MQLKKLIDKGVNINQLDEKERVPLQYLINLKHTDEAVSYTHLEEVWESEKGIFIEMDAETNTVRWISVYIRESVSYTHLDVYKRQAYMLLSLYAVLGAHVWKIWVKGDKIIYRSYIGIRCV